MSHVSFVIWPWSQTSPLRTIVVASGRLPPQPASEKASDPAATAPITAIATTQRRRAANRLLGGPAPRAAPAPITVMPLKRAVQPGLCTAAPRLHLDGFIAATGLELGPPP